MCWSATSKVVSLPEAVERILADKPEWLKDDDYQQKEYERIAQDPPGTRDKLRVVHITDIHYDAEY